MWSTVHPSCVAGRLRRSINLPEEGGTRTSEPKGKADRVAWVRRTGSPKNQIGSQIYPVDIHTVHILSMYGLNCPESARSFGTSSLQTGLETPEKIDTRDVLSLGGL